MDDMMKTVLTIALYVAGLLLIEWVNPNGFTWFDFVTDLAGLIVIVIGASFQLNK